MYGKGGFCSSGNNVILQAGVSIGGDGYGFLKHGEEHVKIPQLGNVVISDDVEIGANSTIDRGRFSRTFIGKGTKIDNLVMVGHNVSIGENLPDRFPDRYIRQHADGDRVTLAGQVGTVGHVQIGSDVTVLKGGVTKSLLKAGIYAGMPARPAKVWRKAIAKLYSRKKTFENTRFKPRTTYLWKHTCLINHGWHLLAYDLAQPVGSLDKLSHRNPGLEPHAINEI